MITNVTGIRQVPPTPTFADRLAEFRAKSQPQLGNAFPWKWLQADFEREFGEAYAREECANGREPDFIMETEE